MYAVVFLNGKQYCIKICHFQFLFASSNRIFIYEHRKLRKKASFCDCEVHIKQYKNLPAIKTHICILLGLSLHKRKSRVILSYKVELKDALLYPHRRRDSRMTSFQRHINISFIQSTFCKQRLGDLASNINSSKKKSVIVSYPRDLLFGVIIKVINGNFQPRTGLSNHQNLT